MSGARWCTWCSALALLLAAPHAAHAQAELELRMQPELVGDVTRIGNRYGVQGGAGLEIPMGYYTRIGVIGAGGADIERGRQDGSGRLDILARFLFDPFRQQRWGVSAGGGVSFRARARDHVRPYLVTVVDLEGPRSSGGISPAFQVGLGGGIRVGVALRWGAERAR